MTYKPEQVLTSGQGLLCKGAFLPLHTPRQIGPPRPSLPLQPQTKVAAVAATATATAFCYCSAPAAAAAAAATAFCYCSCSCCCCCYCYCSCCLCCCWCCWCCCCCCCTATATVTATATSRNHNTGAENPKTIQKVLVWQRLDQLQQSPHALCARTLPVTTQNSLADLIAMYLHWRLRSSVQARPRCNMMHVAFSVA